MSKVTMIGCDVHDAKLVLRAYEASGRGFGLFDQPGNGTDAAGVGRGTMGDFGGLSARPPCVLAILCALALIERRMESFSGPLP
jgi:hypothetical protein